MAFQELVIDRVMADPEPLQDAILFLRQSSVVDADGHRSKWLAAALDCHLVEAKAGVIRVDLEHAIGRAGLLLDRQGN